MHCISPLFPLLTSSSSFHSLDPSGDAYKDDSGDDGDDGGPQAKLEGDDVWMRL